MEICTDCYRIADEPVTLTDDDGTQRVVCKVHTETVEEFLARLGA